MMYRMIQSVNLFKTSAYRENARTRLILSVTAAALLAGTVDAGPIGTYYLTDLVNRNDGSSTLDAIHGNTIVQNASIFQQSESPVAIVGSFVRTTGIINGLEGGEYATSPSLTVSPTGNTWTNGITVVSPDDAVFPDGTSDGVHNYTVNPNTDFDNDEVIATDLHWGGPGTILFTTLYGGGDTGITYDRWNNSLWILNSGFHVISDYTMTGDLISSFFVPAAHSTLSALAMDVDHTLWYAVNGTGYIEHYTTGGTFLGQDYYDTLGFAEGGEIAAPEPATIVLSSMLFGLFGFGWARKRLLASPPAAPSLLDC
jgi:hypothetical protein